MNDEQNMCGVALWSTADMEEGISSHVINTVACTGNEVIIHMAKVTLDNEETDLHLLLFLQKEGAVIGNIENTVTIVIH